MTAMHFDLLQSVSLAGSSIVPNDDRAGAAKAHAWVIDGATDLGPPGLVGTRGGAAWLASEAHAAFTAAADGDLEQLCVDVAGHLETQFLKHRVREPIGRWELPMASFLAVQLRDGHLHCGWLGDCAAIVRRGDRVSRIGPPRHEKDAEAERAARLSEHGLGSPKRSAPILEVLRASRGEPDKAVLGVDTAAMQSLATVAIPCAAGDDVLLMSDGFAALIDSYAALDEGDMMAALVTHGLGALAIRLRQIEDSDPACERFPRFKTSDDATALWLRISN